KRKRRQRPLALHSQTDSSFVFFRVFRGCSSSLLVLLCASVVHILPMDSAGRDIVTTEVAGKADFSAIRYAQCWEDADILLAGLGVRPGDVCLSIASAGDNALALLTRSPRRVIALDLNPAQLACVALRVAAYRTLAHPELLELIGSVLSPRREALYLRCRSQ